jgi:hypothetical protein
LRTHTASSKGMVPSDVPVYHKGYKNRIADLTKSREQWRLEAEQTAERLAALEAEVAVLRSQTGAADKKKRMPAVAR